MLRPNERLVEIRRRLEASSVDFSLEATGLVDVLLRRSLVLADEVVLGMFAKPDGELGELFTKTGHRLLIHVGLGNQFRQGHYNVLAVVLSTWSSLTHPSGGTGARGRKYRRRTCSCRSRWPSPTPCGSRGTGGARTLTSVS